MWGAAVSGGLSQADALTDAGFHGGPNDVDWDRQALVLWRSSQSTCPEALVEVAVGNDGTVEVVTDRDTGPEMGCEQLSRGYHMVVAVDRTHLPARDELPAQLDEAPAWRGGMTARGEAIAWP